jgi:O-antigen ligase
MGLFVIIWVISGNYEDKFKLILNHPAALISIALFCLYGLGMLYSSAPWNIRLSWWMKYHKLLYIPMLISILRIDKYRQLGLHAFLAGMLLVLFISYLKWMGIIAHNDIGQGYFVFKGRIAHNIFMAFTMYLMLNIALQTTNFKRWIWIILSILAAFNILFLVNGRTGQIIMFVLIMWFCWESWGLRSIKWLLAICVISFAIYHTLPSISSSRLLEIKQEITNHRLHGAQTSSGQRLEMYENTVILITQHPLFGGGTGSLESEYAALTKNNKMALLHVTNPHNEFLLTTQELGISGLSMLILMWILHWKATYQLSPARDRLALRGLILTITIGSLFNSLLLDSGEGQFYCVLAGFLLSSYNDNRVQT